MTDKVATASLKCVIVVLLVFYAISWAYPEQFEIVVASDNLVELGRFVDSSVAAYFIARCPLLVFSVMVIQ